jgi:hypothetical protein
MPWEFARRAVEKCCYPACGAAGARFWDSSATPRLCASSSSEVCRSPGRPVCPMVGEAVPENSGWLRKIQHSPARGGARRGGGAPPRLPTARPASNKMRSL